MQTEQGGIIALDSQWFNHLNVPLAVTGVTILIRRPDNTTALAATAATEVSTGVWRYEYAVASGEQTGLWTVEWTGTTPTSATLEAEDSFLVVPQGYADTQSDLNQLRMALSERIPLGGTEADTNFSTAELAQLMLMADGLLERAAAIGWAVKGGDLYDVIDVSENGSERKMSQLFEHCKKTWEFWDRKATALEKDALVASSRVPGRGVDIYGFLNNGSTVISMFSSYDADSVKTFPLYRMPAIL
jgi:hypothetical protein